MKDKIRNVLICSAISLLIISLNLVSATSQGEIDKAKDIINSKVSCDKLTDEQLEILGDYYMEQMHPGELHEVMDERMGGEGSVQLRNVHIAMGKQFYCADNSIPVGMMNMMMGRSGNYGGMMGGGNMMDSGGMMQGIDGNYYRGYNIFGWLFMILIIIVLVLLIIWLIKQIQTPRKNRK